MVSLKSLALHVRIEGVATNVDAQEQMRRFWHLHVKIFSQPTAKQHDLPFASNSSSSISATRNTI